MPPEYGARFPWGASFSYPPCGVKRASTFHLTLDEMAACGVAPLPGPTLCVVRDPEERFGSEVGACGARPPEGARGARSSSLPTHSACSLLFPPPLDRHRPGGGVGLVCSARASVGRRSPPAGAVAPRKCGGGPQNRAL